jgi:sulfopyruvate decarboxylase TPP-binding subunit
MADDSDKENFLYPKANYRGNFSPEHLVFNANLQEFAQKVMYICNLETNGKISPDEAYHEIKTIWKKVKQSKKGLNIGDKPAENSQE